MPVSAAVCGTPFDGISLRSAEGELELTVGFTVSPPSEGYYEEQHLSIQLPISTWSGTNQSPLDFRCEFMGSEEPAQGGGE